MEPDQGAPDSVVTVSWTSETEQNPPKVSCLVRTSTIVLPLAAQPRWLFSDKLETLRIDLSMRPATGYFTYVS